MHTLCRYYSFIILRRRFFFDCKYETTWIERVLGGAVCVGCRRRRTTRMDADSSMVTPLGAEEFVRLHPEVFRRVPCPSIAWGCFSTTIG